MTEVSPILELEAAMNEAGLTEGEQERVRELLDEGAEPDAAIAIVYGERGAAEPEPEPDAGEPAELGEPTKKQLDQLDAEQRRHEKRVHEIMGAHVAGFEPCEACGGVGLLPPGPPPPAPKPHEWFRTCETCNGFGQVLTGSHRSGQEARDCPECKGRGYLEALDGQGRPMAEHNPAFTVTAPTPELAATEPLPPANGSPASFGTPAWMGNPNLGA